jgi:predicted dithiol-disulfide oxidoreductase (DUF899 family)
MAYPEVVTREEWLAARRRLLEPEIVSGDTTSAEVPGLSCFLRDGDDIFHTYSTYARGTDGLGGSYTLLDLTALGRREDWEQPKGRAPRLHGPDPTFTD